MQHSPVERLLSRLTNNNQLIDGQDGRRSIADVAAQQAIVQPRQEAPRPKAASLAELLTDLTASSRL